MCSRVAQDACCSLGRLMEYPRVPIRRVHLFRVRRFQCRVAIGTLAITTLLSGPTPTPTPKTRRPDPTPGDRGHSLGSAVDLYSSPRRRLLRLIQSFHVISSPAMAGTVPGSPNASRITERISYRCSLLFPFPCSITTSWIQFTSQVCGSV